MYGCWRCMEESCKWPWWSWLVLLAVMIVVAYLLQPRRRDGIQVVRVYKRFWWPHPYARQAGLLWRKVVVRYRYFHNGEEME